MRHRRVADGLGILCALLPGDILFTLGTFHQGVYFPTLTNLYSQRKPGLSSRSATNQHVPRALESETGPSLFLRFPPPENGALSYLVSPVGKLLSDPALRDTSHALPPSTP